MLFEDRFRRPEGADRLIEGIRRLELPPVRIMEVCGTHTMAIARSGLRQLLPPHIRLLSGPGCPVCVTPPEVMDEILRISLSQNVTIASYGDLLRVPGSVPGDNLLRRQALGADVRTVYSPMDALEIARQEPLRQVIFLGVGFETTAPGTALTVLEAHRRGIANFFMLSLLKLTPPALRALIDQGELQVNGFLCPGHVATVLGAEAFSFLPREYGLPAVVAGFEAGDILAAVYRLLLQLRQGEPRLENEYTRAVSPFGNQPAQAAVRQVLQPCAARWRGLGLIPGSGLALREEFSRYDAARRFELHPSEQSAPSPCRCGDVICGRLEPDQCPLFGTGCRPDFPVGPCMVSGEGACAAAYHYGAHL